MTWTLGWVASRGGGSVGGRTYVWGIDDAAQPSGPQPGPELELASLAQRRAVFAAAREALCGLSAVLYQGHGFELGDVLGEVDALVALGGGARVAVVAEAASRGQISASQAGSVTGWIIEHAPSLAAGGAGLVATTVDLLRK